MQLCERAILYVNNMKLERGYCDILALGNVPEFSHGGNVMELFKLNCHVLSSLQPWYRLYYPKLYSHPRPLLNINGLSVRALKPV